MNQNIYPFKVSGDGHIRYFVSKASYCYIFPLTIVFPEMGKLSGHVLLENQVVKLDFTEKHECFKVYLS